MFFTEYFSQYCLFFAKGMISYRFHPNIGARVQANENIQMPNIRRRAPLTPIGLADKPLTITLYLSNAIIVIVQMEPHPNREPAKAYSSQNKGPSTHVS